MEEGKVREVDFGLTSEDLKDLQAAYESTMTACEGGGEGAYG